MQAKNTVNQIGGGQFAKIYLKDGHVIKKPSHDSGVSKEMAFQLFISEINIHKGLIHPHIVKLEKYGIVDYFLDVGINLSRSWIALEYANQGDLFEVMRLGRLLPSVKDQLSIMLQVTEALIYLTTMNIVHADIKPENIMINYDNGCKAKLGDFGFAMRLSPESDSTIGAYVCGSPGYVAPEVMGLHRYSYASDLYSLAMVMYFMLFLKNPYGSFDVEESLHIVEAAFLLADQEKDTETFDTGLFYDDIVGINSTDPRLTSLDKKLNMCLPEDTLPEHRWLIENCWQTDYRKRWDIQKLNGYLKELVDNNTGLMKSQDTVVTEIQEFNNKEITPSFIGGSGSTEIGSYFLKSTNSLGLTEQSSKENTSTRMTLTPDTDLANEEFNPNYTPDLSDDNVINVIRKKSHKTTSFWAQSNIVPPSPNDSDEEDDCCEICVIS